MTNTRRAVFLDHTSLDLGDLNLSPLRECLGDLHLYADTTHENVIERLQGATVAISNKILLDADTLAQQLPGWRQPDAAQQWALEVTGPVVATSSAFRFVAPYTGLEVFEKAGTVIGDNDGVPVVTPYDDCVLVMPSVRQARAGVTVVRFARRRLL